MKRRFFIWVLAAAMILSLGMIQPRRAQADTTTDILIYSSIGVGAAIAIVLLATYLTRDDNTLFLEEAPPYERRFDLYGYESQKRRLHIGDPCRKPDGTISLVCW